MSSDVLTGEIPDLLRVGAVGFWPNLDILPDVIQGFNLYVDSNATRRRIAVGRWCIHDEREFALDLPNRLARFIAIEWLGEHGHDARWMLPPLVGDARVGGRILDATTSAALIARSVLRVHGGLSPVLGLRVSWAVIGPQTASILPKQGNLPVDWAAQDATDLGAGWALYGESELLLPPLPDATP